MRNRILVAVVIVMCLIAAGLGLITRKSFTNINADENRMDNFQVAQLTESLTESAIEEMSVELNNSPIIVRVKSTGKVEFLFKMYQQEVEVIKVYHGEGINEGELIKIIKDSWQVFFDDMSINMGFVNFMDKDSEYLVFLERNVDSLYPKDSNVYLLIESLITPIFNYQDKEYKIAEDNGETMYVAYKDVCYNEFFIESIRIMDELILFKKELLKEYTR